MWKGSAGIVQKNFAVVCKLNLARSQAIKLFCEINFPSHSFQSFGVDASDSKRIPQQVTKILRKWGLLEPMGAQLLSQRMPASLDDSTFIVAVDTYIVKSLIELGFQGDKIFNIQDFEVSAALKPTEPSSTEDNKFEYELALNLIAANHTIKKLVGVMRQERNVHVFIPNSADSIARCINDATEFAKDRNSVFIYTDFERTTNFPWENYKLNQIKFDNLSEVNFERIENSNSSKLSIFVPLWEEIHGSKLLLSKKFRDCIENFLKKDLDVILFTCPLEVNGRKNPSAILSTLNSDKVYVID
jgi:protein-tyrosine-phosphatase